MQTVSVTPVIGLPQVQGWSQSVDHAYGGVHLVGTVAISGENASGVGRDIVSIILEQELRNAQHLYQFLEYLQGIAQQKACQLSVTLGIFYLGRCTLCSRQGAVWLKRGEKVGALVEAGHEIALIQGSVKEDDVFIFATQQAHQFLPTIEQQFGQGFDVDGVITSIVPAIHGLENSALSAVSFITITHSENVSPIDVSQPTSEIRSPKALIDNSKSLPVAEPSVIEQPSVGIQSSAQSGIPLDQFINACKRIPQLFSSRTYVGIHLQKKYILWILGLVIGIVLIVSAGVFYLVQAKSERSFAANLVAPYQTQIALAKTTAEQDPVTARAQIESAISELVSLQSQYKDSGRSVVQAKLEETITTAKAVQAEVSGKDEFADLPIYYDLRLASSGFLTTTTTVQGDKGVFVDVQKKNVVVLDLPTKQVFSLDLSSLTSIVSVSPQTPDSIAILADGVQAVALAPDSQLTQIKEAGDSNRAATLLNTFGQYVYVFNPEKRNIYRYAKADKKNTYSDPVGWLQDPLGVSFESITALMIDGDLWLSTNNGQILKFSAGKKAGFSVTGMVEPFSTALFIFTQEGTRNVYVLEPDKKRMVILSKNGQFIREVRSNSLASATGLIVDEQLGKALAVSGSIVYEVAL